MIEKVKTWAIIILVAALLVMAFVSTMILPGCQTFKPTWDPKLPAICNMSLNEAQLFYANKDKSGVMPGSAMCYKILIRTICQAETYGLGKEGEPNPVDYEDAKKFRNYSQCMKELE